MKRIFDLLTSLTLFVILFPISILIIILIYIKLGRPIFFVQQRPGLKSKPFYIYKFRTMLEPSFDSLIYKNDIKRMTRLGWFLRTSSLDEIPQLWNVIVGDMSLVGPRPLLMEYLPLYNKHQLHRHDVLPGITGWAQVNGRNNLSWPVKFDFDIWYVNNHSFLLDMKILLMTLRKVFLGKDVTTNGSSTSEPFKGNNK